jgi:hypothetical protein
MSEYPRTEISPLLENIVNDNPTYDFPVQSIREELVQLFMHQEEYHYFIQQSYRILNRDHHKIFADVFLTTLELVLETNNQDPYLLSSDEYHSKIDSFIEVLENLKITRIEKNSPDGELMSAMV